MSPNSSCVDLLIVGAGPAGLTAACWAAQYRMSTLIVDQKACRTRTGHADGLQCRTLEILDSFGIVGTILEKGVNDVDACYWELDSSTGKIERRRREPSDPGRMSRFGQTLLNQGAVEQAFLDYLQRNGNASLQWRTKAETLSTTNDANNDYPVSVKVKRMGEHCVNDSIENMETIHARYLVGCDGAHSWTRSQLGVASDRNSEDSVWGVLDIIPITDFPDIRESCVIQSEPHGCIMTVPRENRLVRFYIHLRGESQEKAHQDSSPRVLVEMAERIMKPYSLTYNHCDWWSLYTVGQRLVKQYRPHQRIFLAGDAAHTHSPKGGLGMNISIQDTYNLTWKLGSVITSAIDPLILETYSIERRPLANELMELDSRLVQAYEEDDNSMSNRIREIREQYAGFMAGVDVAYPHSILVAKGKKSNSPSLPKNIKLGVRIPSFPVVYQCDGTSIHLAQRLVSNGMWRLLVFPGDVDKQSTKNTLALLGDALSKHPCLTHAQGRSFPLIEPILIHSSPRHTVNLLDLPDIFHPFDDMLGWDYWRVFSDNTPHDPELGQACKAYGIDKEGPGCLIFCRPDQHVAWVGSIEDMSSLDEHLLGFSRIRS